MNKNYTRRFKTLAKRVGNKKQDDTKYTIPDFKDKSLTYEQKMDIVKIYAKIEKHFGRRWLRKQTKHNRKMSFLSLLYKRIDNIEYKARCKMWRKRK